MIYTPDSHLFRPPIGLVARLPFLLNIAQGLLDFQHSRLVACVLAHVVAELDCGAAVCASNLDDDVEGFGLLVGGCVDVVICSDCQNRLDRSTCTEGGKTYW